MDAWRLYYVQPDQHSGAAPEPYKVRGAAPAPAVNRIGEFDNNTYHVKTKLGTDEQFFWARLLALRVYEKPLSILAATEREYIGERLDVMMGETLALTNRPKGALAPNYILNTNLNADPAMFIPLIMSGNTVQGRPVGKNKSGRQMVQIRSYKVGALPTDVTLDDYRVLTCTNISANGVLYGFPQLNGKPVPYPLITRENYYYPADGLKEVKERQEVYK